jgi:SHS2 domain-containing protein
MQARRVWPEGVEPLEHTADLGLLARADSLAELLVRAAVGMRALVEGEDGEERGARAEERRKIEFEAEDLGSLLVAWLRELLYLQQVEGRAFAGAEFERVEETGLSAMVAFEPATPEPLREIKGVTYHGLEAARSDGVWRARVIVDV